MRPGGSGLLERFAAVADRLAGSATRRSSSSVCRAGRGSRGLQRRCATRAQSRRADAPTDAGRAHLAADLVVGNDSSVGHLAAALGTPTIALFGPSNDRAWRPWGAASVVLPADGVSCRPCPPTTPSRCAAPTRTRRASTPATAGQPDGCKHCRCLDLLDADRVAAIACRLLARSAENETPLPPRA
ncbi:MAG: glycosyltransferase family 9 protein [Chloroflexia bacterium]